MSSEDDRNMPGCMFPPAQAPTFERSDASYHYQTIMVKVYRKPSLTNANNIVEDVDVYHSTRRPGFEDIDTPSVQSYSSVREKFTREITTFKPRQPSPGAVPIASAMVADPPLLPAVLSPSPAKASLAAATNIAPSPSTAVLATSAAAGGTPISIASRTGAGLKPVESNDEIQYIKTVYPTYIAKRAGAARPRRVSHPTRQLKMDDFFSHQKPRFAGLPPNLVAALEKSEALMKAVLEDHEELKREVAELVEMKDECDSLFDALTTRMQPLLTSSAHVSAMPTPSSSPTQLSIDGSAPPQDPTGRSLSSGEITDDEYLIRRKANREGKSRATLKRRASSALGPAAKKRRTEY